MTDRTTLSRVHRVASSTVTRGSVRDFEDDHPIQEISGLDISKSRTMTNQAAPLHRMQMVGLTSRPLKQQEEEGGQSGGAGSGGSGGSSSALGDINQNQPKGPSAEAIMLFMNGTHSDGVAMVDDRRVRPYGMKEGETALYAADGSEQMAFFNEKGAYFMSVDGKSVKDKNGKTERMASLRHVTKKMQDRKFQDKRAQQSGGGGQQQQQKKEEYKHEGDTINTEVRCTKGRIEFRAGDKVMGYYDVQADTWFFTGKVIHNKATEQVKDEAPKIHHN